MPKMGGQVPAWQQVPGLHDRDRVPIDKGSHVKERNRCHREKRRETESVSPNHDCYSTMQLAVRNNYPRPCDNPRMHDLRYAIRFLWMHKSLHDRRRPDAGDRPWREHRALWPAQCGPATAPGSAPRAIVCIAAETKDDNTGGFQYSFSIEAMKDFQERAEPFSTVFGQMLRVGGTVDRRSRLAVLVHRRQRQLLHGPWRRGCARDALHRTIRLARSRRARPHVLDEDVRRRPGVIGKAVRVDGVPAVITGVVAKSFRGTLMAVELDGYVTLDDYGVLHARRAALAASQPQVAPAPVVRAAQAGCDRARSAGGDGRADDHARAPNIPTPIRVSVRASSPEPLARPLPMRAVADRHPVRAVLRTGDCRARAPAGVHECREPAARARHRPRARDGGARGARRQPRDAGQVDGHRGPAPLDARRRARLCRSANGSPGRTSRGWTLGADLPLRFDATFDMKVFLFSLAAAVCTGVAVGLWPAWRASRADARAALHDGGKGHSDSSHRQRLRRLLVVGANFGRAGAARRRRTVRAHAHLRRAASISASTRST